MRLISQKGLEYIDVEYESGMVMVNDVGIKEVSVTWDFTHMATYSSRRKAEKVLDDMMKLYGSYISCNGGSGILQGSGYQQAFCFLPPKVFRFPADDEVEV